MFMLLCVILSVQHCFYHFSQGSVHPFYCCLFVFVLFLLKFFLNYYFLIFILIIYYILFYLIFSFFLFFHPFILSHMDERILVLRPGTRALPLTGEKQLQGTGPQETSQLKVISNDESLPEISISTQRPSSTQQAASYSAGHPMPNNQQDRNTTPSISTEAA